MPGTCDGNVFGVENVATTPNTEVPGLAPLRSRAVWWNILLPAQYVPSMVPCGIPYGTYNIDHIPAYRLYTFEQVAVAGEQG